MILGTGYTGRVLFSLAQAEGWEVFATSRTPESHLSSIPPQHRLQFDLNRPDTWNTLPTPAHLVCCFPITPSKFLNRFFANKSNSLEKIILLGSTSAYPSSHTTVTEQHPLNWHLPRVQGEEFLRTEVGAIVLRLAGLYGPGRNPLNWIRQGRIRHPHKRVNLIHVVDAAHVSLKSLTHARPGETFIVSDGIPRRWEEIISYAWEKWQISKPHATHSEETGKCLSNQKLLTELKYVLKFPDLFAALDQIENSSSPR